jgi:hypothetical protein
MAVNHERRECKPDRAQPSSKEGPLGSMPGSPRTGRSAFCYSDVSGIFGCVYEIEFVDSFQTGFVDNGSLHLTSKPTRKIRHRHLFYRKATAAASTDISGVFVDLNFGHLCSAFSNYQMIDFLIGLRRTMNHQVFPGSLRLIDATSNAGVAAVPD